MERVRTGNPIGEQPIDPNSMYMLTEKFPAAPFKQCPVGSPRAPGRQGHVYHVMELGQFFHMVVPKQNTWSVGHKRSGKWSGYKSVKATNEKGA